MTSHKKYRAVFFDAGGTLFKPHPSVGHIYSEVAKKYGMNVDEGKMNYIFKEEFGKRDKEIALKAHASEKNEKEWWRKLVRYVFSQAAEVKDERFDEFFEELYDVFAQADAWRLFPEVIPVLEALSKQELILGIVSNWDSRLHSICKGMNVDRYFNFILASAMVGSAKPHDGIFKEALKQANVKADEAIHIGDSIDNDFFGAKKAGIDALLISRNGHTAPGVVTIDSLEKIITYIQ